MTAKANWTGVEGVIKQGGAEIAWAEASVDLGRGVAVHKRGASESDLKRPGKFDPKGSFTQILTGGVNIARLINGVPTTGTAGAALAATAVIKATAGGEYTAFTDTEPTTPSRVKLTLETQPLTVAGTATVFGEDAAGNSIEETFDLPVTMVATDYLTGSKVFAKAFGILVLAADSASDLGTLKVDYIAGDASVTVGRPGLFDYVFSVVDGTNNVTYTMANCFFTKASCKMGDADEMLDVSFDFEMQDAAADFSFSYVNA